MEMLYQFIIIVITFAEIIFINKQAYTCSRNTKITKNKTLFGEIQSLPDISVYVCTTHLITQICTSEVSTTDVAQLH